MSALVALHEYLCEATIRLLLTCAVVLEDWRRSVAAGATRIRGSLRRLRHDRRPALRGQRPRYVGPRPWNRTPPEIEEQLVRLHVAMPHLGAGQLRALLHRLANRLLSRETVRKVLLRNKNLVVEMSRERRPCPSRVEVGRACALWGADLTLVWVLGFFPVWVLGIVDYHGSRLVALEPLVAPTAGSIIAALDRTAGASGTPERILTDRGSVFRSTTFTEALAERGIAHTMTRRARPWTNGRIERLFRTFKEALRRHYWIVRSERQLGRICADFVRYYNAHRPHQSFGSRTPDEVHANVTPRPATGIVTFFDGRLTWPRLA